MEFRLVILSIACFSCLIPSAVSINLLAAKAVAGQTAESLAAIGAKTLAAKKAAMAKAATDIASIAAQGVALKGQALTTAASSMLGAIINGAVSMGATIAKSGLRMLAAKFGAQPTLLYEPGTIVFQPPVLQDAVVQETIVQEPVVVGYDQAVEVPVRIPPINTVSVDVRPQMIDLPAPPQLSQVWTTVNRAPSSFEIVGPAHSPYVYEIVETPKVYGPLIDSFQFGK